MDLTSIAKEALENTKGFITNNNYKVIEVRENYCKLEAEITQTSINHLNICHGGFLYGLADTAGGVASMTDERVSVTVSSSMNFLRPAAGKKLVAEAIKVKTGQSISVFDVKIYDEKNKIVCTSTFTYTYINKETK